VIRRPPLRRITATASALTTSPVRFRAKSAAQLVTSIVPDAAVCRLARELHQKVLTLAETLGHRHQQARAHSGMAAAWEGTDPARAREHWTTALAIFTELGVPERAEAERRLADLGRGWHRPRVPRQRTSPEQSAHPLGA
jgi:hypothetical protein